MPKVSARATGFNGVNAINANPTPPVRGISKGWTPATARRNKIFLQSIDATQLLDFQGFAVTLTFRDIPETPQKLAKLVHNLQKYMQSKKVQHYHWVIEWTSNGAPHLHVCAYALKNTLPPCPPEYILRNNRNQWDPLEIKKYWIKATRDYATLERAQSCSPIHGSTGWFRYVSKHASRGQQHFQREREALPLTWQGQTGRMWGKSRDWPLQAADYDLSREAYFKVRRWAKNFLKSEARTQLNRVKLQNVDFPKARANVDKIQDRKFKSSVRKEIAARRGISVCRRLNSAKDRASSEVRPIPVSHSANGLSLMGRWVDHLKVEDPLSVATWAAPSTPEAKALHRARWMQGKAVQGQSDAAA